MLNIIASSMRSRILKRVCAWAAVWNWQGENKPEFKFVSFTSPATGLKVHDGFTVGSYDIPTSVHKRRDFLWQLQLQTSCEIKILDQCYSKQHPREIMLYGEKENINAAKKGIMKFLVRISSQYLCSNIIYLFLQGVDQYTNTNNRWEYERQRYVRRDQPRYIDLYQLWSGSIWSCERPTMLNLFWIRKHGWGVHDLRFAGALANWTSSHAAFFEIIHFALN